MTNLLNDLVAVQILAENGQRSDNKLEGIHAKEEGSFESKFCMFLHHSVVLKEEEEGRKYMESVFKRHKAF